MITAEECRTYARQSKLLGSIDIPTDHSIFHSIMSLKWDALADQMDRDNVQTAAAAVAIRSSAILCCAKCEAAPVMSLHKIHFAIFGGQSTITYRCETCASEKTETKNSAIYSPPPRAAAIRPAADYIDNPAANLHDIKARE
ncbi:MAG TPA: hypothetical protein VGC77_08665 [Rhodopseudomonas sp.]|uniref:hypothetical protein n=1 Tax=Rhodopseudomonas sp. TaxID=1078 RepID=UPI002ED7EA1C